MARPLRLEHPGGRYHVTARGNERREIFWDDTDRFHFLGLLSELGQRFGARVHAYVLMANHYHLLLETTEPNLSRTMQWCNVSYSVWFNRRHRRCGHLFQGRFGADLVEDDAGWQEVARYVHLNPVRVAGLGLDKSARAASRAGPIAAPCAELVAERLRVLREYRWSSYRGYAGYEQPLSWVWRRPLASLCGGNTREERVAALRQYTEGALRQGVIEPPWQRLVGGVVLGTVVFAEELRQKARGNPREQKPLRPPTHAASWAQIVAALEQLKGQSWNEFAERHGDWGRDAALWLGRRTGRLRLAELGRLVGNLDYAVVSKAIARFEQRMRTDPQLRNLLAAVQLQPPPK
jgi:REP element-mobilizing transposase RayT